MPPAIAIIPKFLLVISTLRSTEGPRAGPVGLRHALECCGIRAVLATNDKQSAGIAFTFCDNRAEPASSLDRANQAGNFEMRGDSPVHGFTRAGDSRQGRTTGCASA